MNISDLRLRKGHRSYQDGRVSVGVNKDAVGLTLSLDRGQFV